MVYSSHQKSDSKLTSFDTQAQHFVKSEMQLVLTFDQAGIKLFVPINKSIVSSTLHEK